LSLSPVRANSSRSQNSRSEQGQFVSLNNHKRRRYVPPSSVIVLRRRRLELDHEYPRPAADSHEGKVVKTSAGKLVMTDMEGKKEHSMKVPASATVTRDGADAKLSDLKAGDTIAVTTDTKKGKAKVTKVEAKAAEM
jgi:hypothetical protein